MTKEQFKEIIKVNYILGREIIFINIGTNKLIGDCFGPRLGSVLKNKLKIIKSYGTIGEPIHGVNMPIIMSELNKKHMKDFIVGVDACLSSKKSYLRKYYLLDESPIKPGAGLNKELPEVGDMSMKFCISKSHDDVMDTLRNYSEEKLEKRIKKAAKFITELDNELYEIYANNIKNRQEVN